MNLGAIQLVDCLRHRPVATTAAQMREAADLIDQQSDQIIALNQANAAALARLAQLQKDHAEEVRGFRQELRDAVAEARHEERDNGGW